ncbi:MAG TPA: AMP-binding protein, partial [Polyangiaceae bacterium]|nr:AMP-binding protein [Polyangiaceae bacterium]
MRSWFEHPLAVATASASTVASLVASQARLGPTRLALEGGSGPVGSARRTYAELDDRVRRLATALSGMGAVPGSVLAILSENRAEYLEVVLAAAHIGAVVACQNWRLRPSEIAACVELVEPTLAFISSAHADKQAALALPQARTIGFGQSYERLIAEHPPHDGEVGVVPEDPLLLLYTSGTTGRPKAAVISHRAQVVRNLVTRAEFGVGPSDAFVAWSPLYHMGAMDNALGTLMCGGKVIVHDGFDPERLARTVAEESLGWLLLMPGMVGRFIEALRRDNVRPRGVRVCGVMADLVPRHEIQEITRLLSAPYANTFGSTETGCPPCSSSLIPIGVLPERLSKQQSPFCEVKLVGPDDREVAPGEPGELCLRGPTLFSGYFKDDAVNALDFRGGWFHMGDVFVRNPDGSLDFVDRVKYLIKSGGENIYPAEIEAVLLRHPRVLEAAVVRRADARWGEVPVAFGALREGATPGEPRL